MSNDTHAILNQDITRLLGVDTLSEAEQAEFLEQIGEVVMESALVRLVADLNDEQSEQLEEFLDKDPSPKRVLQHLVGHYPQFEKILEEEVVAFKEEVVAVMPPLAAETA